MHPHIGQLAETAASCSQLVDELNAQGASVVADYLLGKPVYNPDFIAQRNGLTAAARARVSECSELRSEDIMAAQAAAMSADEQAEVAAAEQAAMQEATQGKPGETGYLGPGQAVETGAGALAQAQAKIDAKEDPLGWIKGSYSPFGVAIPKWIVWAGGAYLAYTFVTGYAAGRARR